MDDYLDKIELYWWELLWTPMLWWHSVYVEPTEGVSNE